MAAGADRDVLHCHYFAAGACRSCTRIETPPVVQLGEKQRRAEGLIANPDGALPIRWLPPSDGGFRAFRNKAKLVVGGRRGAVTLGILGPNGEGVDLRGCAIQAPAIAAAIPVIAEFLDASELWPYSVPRRQGELKFVHLTAAPDGSLMVRFVVRSERAAERLRANSAALRRRLPNAVVAGINLLPEHKAVLEGEQEIPLWGETLPMNLGAVTLHLQPQSFFQTNTAVAAELYAQVSRWVVDVKPGSLWDLYCGVGGFALHAALALGSREGEPATAITGVEVTPAAIESARRSAREAELAVRFVVADATEFAVLAAPSAHPDLLIVNPPRRGIGPELAGWIEASAIRWVVYSSCNPDSLASDLARMPSLAVREGRVFDMFPHTDHFEVAVLLERVRPGEARVN